MAGTKPDADMITFPFLSVFSESDLISSQFVVFETDLSILLVQCTYSM